MGRDELDEISFPPPKNQRYLSSLPQPTKKSIHILSYQSKIQPKTETYLRPSRGRKGCEKLKEGKKWGFKKREGEIGCQLCTLHSPILGLEIV